MYTWRQTTEGAAFEEGVQDVITLKASVDEVALVTQWEPFRWAAEVGVNWRFAWRCIWKGIVT